MGNSITEKVLKFSPGEFLFKQGEKTNSLYILKTGEVRIFKKEGSAEVELERAGPGMVIGEVASIDNGVRCASGVAVKNVEAYWVSGERFRVLTNNVPEWLKKISLILARRLRELDEKISFATVNDKKTQIGAVLYLIACSDNSKQTDEGIEVSLKFLENELVDILNVQYSEVTETLEHFESQKLIQVRHSKVIIKSKTALKKLADDVFESSLPTPAT